MGSRQWFLGQLAYEQRVLPVRPCLVARPDADPLKAAFLDWRARPEIISWLDEAALFDAIGQTPGLLGSDWWDWPDELRRRDPAALAAKRAASGAAMDEFCATQFLFDKQWMAAGAGTRPLLTSTSSLFV